MNENVEVRFSRLERAPAYKTVSDAILKDITGGRLRIGCRVKRSSLSSSASIAPRCAKAYDCRNKPGCCGASSASGSWSAAHPMTALAIGQSGLVNAAVSCQFVPNLSR
jgi:hypothetical protein